MMNCLILGDGVSGRAALRLATLLKFNARIVTDAECSDPEQATADAELIVTSPGVKPLVSPLYRASKRRADTGEAELISELEFGFRHLPRHRCLAVTGTNGKTTTTELVCHLLNAVDCRAVPAGNIGIPLADVAAEMLEGKLSIDALPVVETSSFQLERVRDYAPLAAVLLNLESDHVDRYAGGFDEYSRIKRSIFDRVVPENRICGLSLPPETPRRVTISGDRLFFDGQPLVDLTETSLNAPHNRENLAAAVELALRVLPRELVTAPEFAEAIRSFEPRRHRLEIVVEHDGIRFIDDSKATNPASVVAALRSLPDPGYANVSILLGGLDKAMDFSPLASWSARIKFAALYGECRAKIAAAIGDACPTEDCGMDFSRAFQAALRHAKTGDIVLLSPACASMDMFRNYQERGDRFSELARGGEPRN